jgi:hypothetical protein
MNGKENTSDFVIGIRMTEGKKADHEQLRSALHKYFYKNIRFVFINLNAMGEEGNKMFLHGTVFTGRS